MRRDLSCACPPTDVENVGLELTVAVCEGDTLQSASDRYFAPEQMDVLCDSCGVGHAGTRHWTITALPPVLIIQLLRYMTTSAVAVGESLCTDSWMLGAARRLQLSAVVCHHGGGSTILRHSSNFRWAAQSCPELSSRIVL
eukprot:1998475-Rhodomonas_salina.1